MGQGFNGLELLLMSFARCSDTTVLYLLRMLGRNISRIKVSANGLTRDQSPIKFEKIFLEFLLTSEDTEDADIQKAIQLAEASVCPVWQMIKNNAEVTAEYKITASQEGNAEGEKAGRADENSGLWNSGNCLLSA